MTNSLPLFGQARGKLPFSPQGWLFLIPTTLLTAAAFMLCWTIAGVILLLLLLFMLNFFRDPERNTPQGPGLFVSPADGKVVTAEKTAAGVRVDIFMNVFNVHVNRAPMQGNITDMTYTRGRFVNASFPEASEENERNRFEMQCEEGNRVFFTQIAGLVARRIVSYVQVGDAVECGQRIGMIRFGSRVNCEMPADYALNVSVGEHVTAGLTVLGQKSEVAQASTRADNDEVSDVED